MILSDICKDIFVINLIRRTDRYDHVASQAIKHGFSFFISSAVDSQEIKNPTKLRPGEHALLLSHANVINLAKKRNLEKIIIFEDDFECVENFNERLIDFNHIPPDWDLVYFGGNRHPEAGSTPRTKINKFVNRLQSTFCTHSILIKNTMYDHILNSICQLNNPLRIIYTDLQKKFNVYGFVNTMCRQYDSVSDIIGFNAHYNKQGVFD